MTRTPLPSTSLASAAEKLSTNALVATFGTIGQMEAIRVLSDKAAEVQRLAFSFGRTPARALLEYRVGGIKTNLTFHRRVMQHAVFGGGDYSTAFTEENKAELLRPIEIADSDEALDAALAAAALEALHQESLAGGTATDAGTAARSRWQDA